MDNLIESLAKLEREAKLATLKRWGQEACTRCGEPLETLFDQNGKNPIRVCGRCETENRNAEA
jgi:hypothetical protein